ncbi:MAG: hypothetical protein ABSH46_19575 [Bryobacteraceae bacterium]
MTKVKVGCAGVTHLAHLYAIFMFPGLDFCMPLRERISREAVDEGLRKTTVHPGGSVLRRAIRMNIVSFPAQIPVLLKQPQADTQWRMVLLYFVRGWSQPAISARFGVPIHRVSRSINEWSIRALALGYIQVIDPKAFAACCGVDAEYEASRGNEEIRLAAVRPLLARQESGLSGSPAESGDLIATLDAAIAHCDEWGDEFWARAGALLRDLRAVAAGRLRHEPPIREEERVSHAVA